MATTRDPRVQVHPEAVHPHEIARQPAKPYRILYGLLLVVTYLSVMADLFLIVLTHGPAVALKVALAMLVVCVCLSLIPFALFAMRSRTTSERLNMRTLWNIYSWQQPGKTERTITAVVFATVMIALGLIVSHGRFR